MVQMFLLSVCATKQAVSYIAFIAVESEEAVVAAGNWAICSILSFHLPLEMDCVIDLQKGPFDLCIEQWLE